MKQQEQGERWATQNVLLEGGLQLDKDPLWQASQMSGSALQLVNFEPSLNGGYHRILGYQPFDTAQLPNGATQVFGVVVPHFEASVIAMQSGKTYRSTGSGWTKISGSDVHSAMGIVQHTSYAWATNRFTFVDGDPSAYPVRVEASGTYTILTNAPTGQKFIQEFEGYLWMSSGNSTLTFSAPQNDNDYNAGDGAGSINVGFNIVDLGVWRGALYVFGVDRISQITGTSAADWTNTLLTDDVGMTGTYSLQEVNGDLVFMAADGLRTISGTARIFDRELGVISRPITSLILPLISSNLTSVTVRAKSQYRIFQATSSTIPATAQGVIGTLKLQTSGSVAWEWSSTLGMQVACADSGLYNGVELVVHGGFDGYVYKQESGTTFNGAAINAVYQTPFLIYNDPMVRKILYKLCANFLASGACSLNLGIAYDYSSGGSNQPPSQTVPLTGGTAVWDTGQIWDSGTVFWDNVPNTRTCINLIGSGFSSSFIFSTAGGADFSLQAYSVTYGSGARR